MPFAERFLSYTETARLPPPAYAEIVHLENVVVDATDRHDVRGIAQCNSAALSRVEYWKDTSGP